MAKLFLLALAIFIMGCSSEMSPRMKNVVNDSIGKKITDVRPHRNGHGVDVVLDDGAILRVTVPNREPVYIKIVK